VTAHTPNTTVLVFEADKFAQILRTETATLDEILRTYMLKLPNRKDYVPSYSDFYRKTFKSIGEWGKNSSEEGVGLPSKELRALLINGTEYDRRHEFEEIVRDFPKINDQKQLKMISELKQDLKEQSPEHGSPIRNVVPEHKSELAQLMKHPRAEELKREFKIGDM
jgi:hypothetical protein